MEDVSNWREEMIEGLRNTAGLADSPYSLLQSLQAEKQQAVNDGEEIKALQAEYGQIVTLQEQLRKNLDALGNSERELSIRNRVLDDLETSENRRREIESRMTILNAQMKQSQRNQQSIIDQLYS
jgi:hypothetical protein